MQPSDAELADRLARLPGRDRKAILRHVPKDRRRAAEHLLRSMMSPASGTIPKDQATAAPDYSPWLRALIEDADKAKAKLTPAVRDLLSAQAGYDRPGAAEAPSRGPSLFEQSLRAFGRKHR
ncbi:hypothetical protein [Novosphingopyxis sp.]|uniref:hypothetical protein n=1 Tax=Novosphingopyxis sp. TaxID=2709690 RepID=UPI003B58E1A4